MKSWIKWLIAALVIALLAAGIARVLSTRKAQQAALAIQTASSATQSIELIDAELVQVRQQTVARSLPIAGTLKALNAAFVKARVAGELQGLLVREGDSVKAGQVLAQIDPAEYQARLRQAQQQADASQAQIEIAQRQFDNNKALVEQGFISKTALDTSIANLNAAKATYQAAVSATDVASKTAKDTVMTAPIAGLIAQRLAQPGERVAIDTRILEIVDLSSLELEAALSPADSVAVRIGQNATLQIEGSAQTVSARVVRINPSAQAGSRSILVYLSLQPLPGLRQGLFAQGSLATTSFTGLTLPLSAVRTDKPTPYVQVVENRKVVHRPVTLGERGEINGSMMVGVEGLAENTVVLAGSVGAVREGVSVTTPAPNAAAAVTSGK